MNVTSLSRISEGSYCKYAILCCMFHKINLHRHETETFNTTFESNYHGINCWKQERPTLIGPMGVEGRGLWQATSRELRCSERGDERQHASDHPSPHLTAFIGKSRITR